MGLFAVAVVILVALAISDLVVGVSNDAVNFLNSSIGSRVASRRVIMVVASLGILAGVTFSSGMMEVARKGIFHPEYFTMPELMVLFLAVMLTDVILLDLFNTFALPTSTTVSIVFELLGAAVAVSLLKLHRAGGGYGALASYINTSKALTIIFGILLSVAIAFLVGAAVQLVTRLLFTFDYAARLRRWGALWGGAALASIVYFILIKGAKGTSFLTADTLVWVKAHTALILGLSFVACAIVLEILILLTKVHILRLITLAGTFALAMAFAANDLVNFIGVPLAGLAAHTAASASGRPLAATMEALAEPVRANTLYLLIAGAVMVVTLWISRKARSVTKTEVRLGRQDEGYERFEATLLSQTIVRLFASVFDNAGRLVPGRVREAVSARLDRSDFRPAPEADGSVPSFDLVRASVNLVVAAALISFATSLKLPLSTTYVTFMVAMGTSLSDQAWGRDSAVYRVAGVLTVIGGWFFTAMVAFTVAALFATAIDFGRGPAVVALVALAVALVVRTHRLHRSREREEQAAEVFNLRKIKDSAAAIGVTSEHAGLFLREVGRVLDTSLDGLFVADRARLRLARQRQRRVQQWANVIGANIFKVFRLLQWEDVADLQRYSASITALQEVSESVRDVVLRAQLHVANNHSGLLAAQVAELEQVRQALDDILERTSEALLHRRRPDLGVVARLNRELRVLAAEFDQNQIMRIQDNSSKTRLSILFYSCLWDCLKIAEQTTTVLTVFEETLSARPPSRAGAVPGPEPAPAG